MKLRIQLVPKPLFGQNLRSALGKGRWDKLRRKLIEANGARCKICGNTERLHSHEIWSYREKSDVASAVLLKVEITCINCHDICHWARTTKLYERGIVSHARYKALQKHFRSINDYQQKEFDDYFLRSRRTWARRSKKQWKIDWGDYTTAVNEAAGARAASAAANPMIGIENDYQNAGPGHHMPAKCPACGYALRLKEEDTSEMSEAQEADYTQGVSGIAVCLNCNHELDW